ncbi:hypothetical protein LCGC14_1894890, partial [marine sediment metagenome]
MVIFTEWHRMKLFAGLKLKGTF